MHKMFMQRTINSTRIMCYCPRSTKIGPKYSFWHMATFRKLRFKQINSKIHRWKYKLGKFYLINTIILQKFKRSNKLTNRIMLKKDVIKCIPNTKFW
jgi:hypothetical protein